MTCQVTRSREEPEVPVAGAGRRLALGHTASSPWSLDSCHTNILPGPVALSGLGMHTHVREEEEE